MSIQSNWQREVTIQAAEVSQSLSSKGQIYIRQEAKNAESNLMWLQNIHLKLTSNLLRDICISSCKLHLERPTKYTLCEVQIVV